MNCTGKRCIMQYDKVDPATCQCVSYCPQATPPKTNADLIRSMTDEELAELINFVFATGAQRIRSSQFWRDWLKQEVEENK